MYRLTDDEIKETATKLVQARLFCASMAPPEMMPMIFMPLGLAGLPDDINPEDIGNIVEDLDKSMHFGVNGYPTFGSCRIVHKDDWAQIVERASRAQAAMEGVLDGQ